MKCGLRHYTRILLMNPKISVRIMCVLSEIQKGHLGYKKQNSKSALRHLRYVITNHWAHFKVLINNSCLIYKRLNLSACL
jgi:hypothetical protein